MKRQYYVAVRDFMTASPPQKPVREGDIYEVEDRSADGANISRVTGPLGAVYVTNEELADNFQKQESTVIPAPSLVPPLAE